MLDLNQFQVIRDYRPLKIGIIKDLFAALPDEDPAEIAQWLKRHTQTRRYLESCVQLTAIRVDLKGRAVDAVTGAQKAYCYHRLGGWGSPQRETLQAQLERMAIQRQEIEENPTAERWARFTLDCATVGQNFALSRGMHVAPYPFNLHALAARRYPKPTLVGDPDIVDGSAVAGELFIFPEYYIRDHRPTMLITQAWSDADLDTILEYLDLIGLEARKIDGVDQTWFPLADTLALVICRQGEIISDTTEVTTHVLEE